MKEIYLLDFLKYYLSKWCYVFIAIFVILLVTNIYILFIKTPLYKSTTTIFLPAKDTTDVSYSEVIKGNIILDEVIKENNLKYTYSELSDMIDVYRITNTDMVKITVSSSNKNETKPISESLVSIFSVKANRVYGFNDLVILSKPQSPEKPFNINIIQDNIMFFVFGFIFISVILFITYYSDSSIKSSCEIEDKYKLVLLGCIPNNRKE